MVVLAVSSAQSVARASGIGRSCSIVYMPPTTKAESSPMLWPKLNRACGTGIVEKLFEQTDLGQLHADDRADIVNESLERGRFAQPGPGLRGRPFCPARPHRVADAESRMARTTGP